MPKVNQMESSFAEREMGVLMDIKLATSLQYPLAEKKANSLLRHIRKSFTSILREVIHPFCSSTGEPHLQCSLEKRMLRAILSILSIWWGIKDGSRLFSVVTSEAIDTN